MLDMAAEGLPKVTLCTPLKQFYRLAVLKLQKIDSWLATSGKLG